MTTGAAIEVRGLRKAYGPVQAVDGVDLDVGRGEVVAVLGPNGAGKTTTVEILEGHRERDDGEVRVLGHDPALRDPSLRARVGIVLQETGVEPYLTVEEVVDLHRGWYPRSLSLDHLLELTGIEGVRRHRAVTLSGGQRRRLDVALGLAGDPEVLFLDEPTTGFDPAARRDAWAMVRALRDLGTTILLTTHYMDEAEQLADRVVVMANGRIVADGRPAELRAAAAGRTRIAFREPRPRRALPARLRRIATRSGSVVTIDTDAPTATLHVLTAWAAEVGVELEGLTVAPPSMEDVYLGLVAGEGGRCP